MVSGLGSQGLVPHFRHKDGGRGFPDGVLPCQPHASDFTLRGETGQTTHIPEGALGLGQATKSDSGSSTGGECPPPQVPPPFAASPDTCWFAVLEVHFDLRGGLPVLPLERRLHGGWPNPMAMLFSVCLTTIFLVSIPCLEPECRRAGGRGHPRARRLLCLAQTLVTELSEAPSSSQPG